jgi:hypothetical protein
MSVTPYQRTDTRACRCCSGQMGHGEDRPLTARKGRLASWNAQRSRGERSWTMAQGQRNRCAGARLFGRDVGITDRPFGPRVRDEPVAIRHAHRWKRAGIHHTVFVDDAVSMQKPSDDRIHLIGHQRLRRRERHGSIDIIIERRGIRPVTADRLYRMGCA